MSEIIMKSENLSFRYKNSSIDIINDVSINIEKGRFTAIVGPNGCGKSTLFKILMGEVKANSGAVYFENEIISNINSKERAKKIAVVHQKNQSVLDFTVREVVSMGRTPYLGIFNSLSIADKKAIDNALYLVGLLDLQNRYCNQLSGGQLQRVWLALALAQEPDLILLDEPTTYLDVKYQLQLMEMVRELVDNHNLTCVSILHDLNQVVNFSDYTYFMKNGKIVGHGESKEIVNSKYLEEVFGVKSEILNSYNSRKVIDLFLGEDDKNVHKDIKRGQILQI